MFTKINMDYRYGLVDKVIRKYGFEHPKTIWFARRAEYPTIPDEELTTDFNKLMK